MRCCSIALFVLVAGCADPASPPTWEEFRDEASREFEGEQFFVTGGDLAVTENELAELYAAYFVGDDLGTSSQESIVNRVGGRDDKWQSSQALDLRYCVSNEFGTRKSRVVNEMGRATAAWEAVAKVNFTYVSAQDGNCRNTNRNVVFSVRPWTSGGACAFFPSGGGCVARTLVINIPDLESATYEELAPNMTTEGVFRHELGHILGLRHEHTRRESGVCFENNQFRALTTYDQSSVMHYPWCNGRVTSDLSITSKDAQGAAALYPR
jgi:hypothetical protein